MLHLRRKVGETIKFGEDDRPVFVVVKGVSGNNVELGIHAPDDMLVLRGEVRDNGTRPRLGQPRGINKT